MSKKFIVIKTSGGVITDVWKDVVGCPSEPDFNHAMWRFELLQGEVVRVSGEITVLEFESGKAKSINEYSKYIEYHSSLDPVLYSVCLRTSKHG